MMDLTAPAWFYDVGQTLLKLLPGGLLTVWCLWAVNWRRTWPVLAAGGWVPLVLIGLMAAYVWSLVWPTNALVLGLFVVPNQLWQLGSVAVLIGVVLFCGWLQTRYGWEPPEISLEPPAHGHGHDHGHGPEAHAHHEAIPAVVQTNGHAAH
jgi:hypothetical protein